MSMIARSFADRYAELVAYAPTLAEMMLDVQRREVGERKVIEEQFQVSFKDMLHVAAITIADRKARERRSGKFRKMNVFELALYKKETAVWFPAAPPRKVDFPTNRPLRAFPHAAFAELCDEERELRYWLNGVEGRLRRHIEEACGRVWFFENCLEKTVSNESRSRFRLEAEQETTFTWMKRRFFRGVPADYYRQQVLERYGATEQHQSPHSYDDDVEYLEEVGRMALEEEEEAAGQAMYQDLQDAFAVQLFSVRHRELLARREIVEAERDGLYPLLEQCCREDFGLVFYQVPSIALHLGAAQPCLRALCVTQLQEATRRTAAVKAQMSWYAVVESQEGRGKDDNALTDAAIDDGITARTQEDAPEADVDLTACLSQDKDAALCASVTLKTRKDTAPPSPRPNRADDVSIAHSAPEESLRQHDETLGLHAEDTPRPASAPQGIEILGVRLPTPEGVPAVPLSPSGEEPEARAVDGVDAEEASNDEPVLPTPHTVEVETGHVVALCSTPAETGLETLYAVAVEEPWLPALYASDVEAPRLVVWDTEDPFAVAEDPLLPVEEPTGIVASAHSGEKVAEEAAAEHEATTPPVPHQEETVEHTSPAQAGTPPLPPTDTVAASVPHAASKPAVAPQRALPKPVFSRVEVFHGDPFAETPPKAKKAGKAKKGK